MTITTVDSTSGYCQAKTCRQAADDATLKKKTAARLSNPHGRWLSKRKIHAVTPVPKAGRGLSGAKRRGASTSVRIGTTVAL